MLFLILYNTLVSVTELFAKDRKKDDLLPYLTSRGTSHGHHHQQFWEVWTSSFDDCKETERSIARSILTTIVKNLRFWKKSKKETRIITFFYISGCICKHKLQNTAVNCTSVSGCHEARYCTIAACPAHMSTLTSTHQTATFPSQVAHRCSCRWWPASHLLHTHTQQVPISRAHAKQRVLLWNWQLSRLRSRRKLIQMSLCVQLGCSYLVHKVKYKIKINWL